MSLWRQLQKLVGTWFRWDRIRVSPTTGRLLGLRAGDRFVMRNEVFFVDSVNANSDCPNPCVEYLLSSSRGECRLLVEAIPDNNGICGELHYEDSVETVFDDDISLLTESVR